MVDLIRHETQDIGGTDGHTHTAGLQTKTIVKYALRKGWSGTVKFTCNANIDGTGETCAYELSCAARADAVTGVVTIDGSAPPVVYGLAALEAIALTVDGTTNAGCVSLVTPGLAGNDIWWVSAVDVWGNKP